MIATNNPNIDIPKVVDEVERLEEACSEDLSSAEINDIMMGQEQFEQDLAQFIADNWSSEDYISRRPDDEYPLNQFDVL